MATRAIALLSDAKVPFDVVKYNHREKGAAFAARATGFALSQTVKTLVVDIGGSQYVLALTPGDASLDLRRLAKACSSKRAAMAPAAAAERITGYRTGGISPFGTRQRLVVIMERRLLEFDEVMINAGQRGIMLKMRPLDILGVLGARTSAIT
jgi:Cys-tRNA(Pro)/Cys-tRNA(Cys) deacylase